MVIRYYSLSSNSLMTPAFNTGVAIQEALGSLCETEAWFLRLDVGTLGQECISGYLNS
jgi:hypothetical protein